MIAIKKISTFLLSLSLFFVLGAILVHAQPGGGNPPGTGNPPGGGNPPVDVSLPLQNPFKGGVGTSLFTLMKAIVDNIILPVGGVVAVLAFIYAGFLYVTASGDESKIKKAHSALLVTVIGTAVLLGSWVLANAICQTISQLSTNPLICS